MLQNAFSTLTTDSSKKYAFPNTLYCWKCPWRVKAATCLSEKEAVHLNKDISIHLYIWCSDTSSQWPFIIVCDTDEVVEGVGEDKLGALVKKLSSFNLRCSGWSSLTLASSMSLLMAMTRASLERKSKCQWWEDGQEWVNENTHSLQRTQNTKKKVSIPGTFVPLWSAYCHWNNDLCLNTEKTKGKIIELRKGPEHPVIHLWHSGGGGGEL